MNARERAISKMKKEMKDVKTVLTDLEAIQRFTKTHKVEGTRYFGPPKVIEAKVQTASDTVTKFTWELEKLISYVKEMVHHLDDCIAIDELDEATGVPYRDPRKGPKTRRFVKEMDRQVKQAEKEKEEMTKKAEA
jgi:hypothetical protein